MKGDSLKGKSGLTHQIHNLNSEEIEDSTFEFEKRNKKLKKKQKKELLNQQVTELGMV